MIRGVLNMLCYPFLKERIFFLKLYRILGFPPGDISLYKEAFIHRSASLQLKDGSRLNNERLEYLGDAILGAIVAEYLYREFKMTDEGFLTKLRSRIVKRKHLNTIAVKMGIPDLIISHQNPAHSSKQLFGNALEALIGAIYLDRGYGCVFRFFKKRMVGKYIDLDSLVKKDTDYKSRLIEWVQKNKYEIQFLNHEEHDPENNLSEFKSVVIINQSEAGNGIANSRKEAEQQAAKVALNDISE